jgi:acyl dehydratase
LRSRANLLLDESDLYFRSDEPRWLSVIRVLDRCDISVDESFRSPKKDQAMAKYVTDEVLKQIGKAGEARTLDVERGAIRRFAEAIGDSSPQFNNEAEARNTRFGGMIAPPTFYRSLSAAIPDVDLNMPSFRGLDGGSDWEYFEPTRPGDRITVQTKIADIRESEGRLGTMVIVTTETSYTNQFGRVCALQRSRAIRY